jgi:hypothetical protein
MNPQTLQRQTKPQKTNMQDTRGYQRFNASDRQLEEMLGGEKKKEKRKNKKRENFMPPTPTTPPPYTPQDIPNL